jgi:hypothetical protein
MHKWIPVALKPLNAARPLALPVINRIFLVSRLKEFPVFLGHDAATRIGGMHVEAGPGDVPPDIRPRVILRSAISRSHRPNPRASPGIMAIA